MLIERSENKNNKFMNLIQKQMEALEEGVKRSFSSNNQPPVEVDETRLELSEEEKMDLGWE